MTLKDRLSSRHNLLNAVRIVFAAMVILGHAWPLTGASGHGLEILSDVAVNGFFLVSGYLIAESRTRTQFVPYLWRRLLRIYPGFLVSLLVVAAIFAPLGARLGGQAFDLRSAAGFVLSNSALRITQWEIDGSLAGAPVDGAWNGSLWTLFYEAVAYLALGAVLSLSVAVRRARWVLPALALAVIGLRVLAEGPLEVTTTLYLNGLRLAGYFLAGAAVWAWADRWRPRPWHVAAAVAVYLVLTNEGWADLFGQFPLAVAVLGIGSLPSHHWTTRTDLSYGVYIYAYPVQQLLVMLGTAAWGVTANIVLTVVLVLPLAFLSWTLVEKPALRAKRLLDPRVPVSPTPQ
ncbi:acyltransferase family protein [Kocuria turfanensis]|uniref:acyltransferase family protein n=1 Tax=Kocuria turfanensis TaxID=388357 RepID=UPI004035E08C